MANKYSIEISGYHVKELRCKNDNCRALFGYEKIGVGVVIFTCSRCGQQSIFNIKYREIKREFIQKIQSEFKVSKGGE
jgi:RNase P subunit RPR2